MHYRNNHIHTSLASATSSKRISKHAYNVFHLQVQSRDFAIFIIHMVDQYILPNVQSSH